MPSQLRGFMYVREWILSYLFHSRRRKDAHSPQFIFICFIMVITSSISITIRTVEPPTNTASLLNHHHFERRRVLLQQVRGICAAKTSTAVVYREYIITDC